ncbi:MAG TPA: phage major capsid protein [Candidatus Polarisedimenticolia bacterium]|jgi:HK97 family phage major capsid protein|nr:phage major capsid protein [Candidatus Polarisedimenticolia bacterium]
MDRKLLEEADRLANEVRSELDETKRWIGEVEAKQNSARFGRLSPGDNALNGIPAEEPIRKQVEIAARMGISDPVKVVGNGYWWKCQIAAKMAARNPTGTPPSDWIERADRWEKANGFDPEEKFRHYAIQKAAVGEGAGGGGSVIALPVEAELRRQIRDSAVFNKLATHVLMESLTHQVPIENANVTALIVAEGAIITDSMPTTSFTSGALTAKKYAGLATLSSEVLSDNVINLQQTIFSQIAEAIGIVEDQNIFNSANSVTGLSSVVGRFTTNVSGFAAAGNNQGSVPIWFDMVTAMFKGLQRSSRANGRWFMHPGVYKNLLTNVDTTTQPIIAFSNNAQTPTDGRIPFSITGFPVELSAVISTQDSVYTTSSSIYFLDPQRVLYGDLIGMRFDIDPYGLFSTDQVRIRVLQRLGILVPVGGYVSHLQGAKAV